MRRGAAGRASAGALAGTLALLALLVAGAWLALREPAPDARGARGAGAPAPPRPGDGAAAAAPDLERPAETRPGGAAATAVPPDPARAFDGKGVLRGEVIGARGTAVPERWTLIVEPSRMLAGRDRATTRRIEFERGERTFELTDLPLAGYSVRATAAGSNSQALDVLLVASSPAVFVTLAFAPAGFVEGRAQRADGTAAEGLAVTLERAGTGERLRAVCDVNGAWIVRDVPDGEYRVLYGTPEAPLVPPREIAFRAPSLRVTEVVLPPVGTLLLRVRDDVDALVPGAVVTGTSSAGGAFTATTDANGEARERYLVPGTWRIEARVEAASGVAELERSSGRVTFELQAGPEQECLLRIRR
jgi:hypothetical protein